MTNRNFIIIFFLIENIFVRTVRFKDDEPEFSKSK